jgi:hypothetical protein
MARPSLLCLVVCVASFALAQNTSPVQVLYALSGKSIITYNVDPQTLNASKVGSPLTVYNATPGYSALYPSPNDHFIYFFSPDSHNNEHLWVFATDASGVPQAPATQVMTVNGLWDIPQFDPHANFAYMVFKSANDVNYNATYSLRRYAVDPATGRLSQPVVEAQYVLPDDPSGAYCWLSLMGFNPAATIFYDAAVCGNHDTEGGTYYERTLNSQTGALGPDVQIYSWSAGNGGYENIQFIHNLMFDFVVPNSYQQGIDWLNIDPIKPNTTPSIHCTATMLEACGNATGVAHPSGKYVFMQISPDTTQIERVELGQHKIVDTGNYFPYQLGRFSPDGSLLYGYRYQSPGYILQIYGFNQSTSAVTQGGQIYAPDYGPYVAAERY